MASRDKSPSTHFCRTGGRESKNRKRPHSPESYRRDNKYPRYHSPSRGDSSHSQKRGRSYCRESDESHQKERNHLRLRKSDQLRHRKNDQSYHRKSEQSHRRRDQSGDQPRQEDLTRKSQPTCLSADEAALHRAVSYTGSHGDSDGWVLGDQVLCPMDEKYYTLKEGVVCPTHQLFELQQLFRETLLTVTTHTTPPPAHTTLPSSHTTPPHSHTPPSTSKDSAVNKMPESSDNQGTESPEDRRVHPSIPYNSFNETLPTVPTPSPGPWHTYILTLTPQTNFKTGATFISSPSGQMYKFRGYMLVTKTPLHSVTTHEASISVELVPRSSLVLLDGNDSLGLPKCQFQRYSVTYTVELTTLSSPTVVFTSEDIHLFNEYLLVHLLELYDLVKEFQPLLREGGFLPLFVSDSKSQQEILSMVEVLKFLLASHQPLKVKSSKSKGQLVSDMSKRPHCLRVDETSLGYDRLLEIGHTTQQPPRSKASKNDSSKKLKSQYYHLLSKKNRGKLTRNEHFKFVELRRQVESQEGSSGGRGGILWLPGNVFKSTGLYTDIVQHVILLSTVGQHVLFNRSLVCLQETIGYSFKDHSLLHRALTHPSTTTLTYQCAEDHLKTVLSNCGPTDTVNVSGGGPRVAKGLKGLMNSLEHGDEGTWIEHNEQLEFLGDAVLEYITSVKLFHKSPPLTVGQLNNERQLLVKNARLWQLAQRVGLANYMLINRKVEGGLEHAGANCFEALLGAVYLDCGDVDVVDSLFARLAFPDQEERDRWTQQSTSVLAEEQCQGDRHLIQDSEELQSVVGVEEKLGVEFTNVRLLARAFTHSSHQDNSILSGNYQRLEFFGDAVLQFLVSKHVYLTFPSHHEGHLTMLRMALVHNKHLASLCRELGLDKHIIVSKNEKVDLNVKLLADVVESFLAALTLDKGLSVAEEFLRKHLFPRLLEGVRSSHVVDANTRLHQATAYTCKQQGVSLELPVYKVMSPGGTATNPEFTVSVFFEKKLIGTGKAGSIREARRLAAEEGLKSSFVRVPPSLKGVTI